MWGILMENNISSDSSDNIDNCEKSEKNEKNEKREKCVINNISGTNDLRADTVNSNIIEAAGIVKNYGFKKVLKGADLYLKRGECVGIVGANGCGKTTLLGVLAGTQKPSGGRLSYGGQNPLKNRKIFSDFIGYVPQENPLMEQLSVLDNLKFWYCGSKGKLKKDMINGAPAALGLTDKLYTRVDKLSGGTKKRLSIACALANDAPVLIMDEPGASLDIVCKEDIRNYLKDYVSGGGTVIIASHEQEELSICDRLYVMRDGVLMEMPGHPDAKTLMEYIRV